MFHFILRIFFKKKLYQVRRRVPDLRLGRPVRARRRRHPCRVFQEDLEIDFKFGSIVPP